MGALSLPSTAGSRPRRAGGGLRWGVLSTANITGALLGSGTDQEFVAVASRDAPRAQG